MSELVPQDASRWFGRGASLAGGALLVVGITALAIAASSVLVLVFIAVVLAAAMGPLTDRLREHLPTGRAGTLLLAYGIGLLVLILGTVLVVPTVVRQAQGVLAVLPITLAETRAWAEGLRPEMASTAVLALTEFAEEAAARANLPGTDLLEASSGAAAVVGGVVTTLALAAFWLLERPRLQRYALAFLPASRRAGVREAWNDVEAALGKWVRAQIITMVAFGVASGVAYLALGLSSALLLAVIAAIGELIPIVGPLIGAIPAVLVAATISPELAALVVLISVGLQVLDGLILVPLVTRQTVGLSPLLVFLAVLIGGAVGGIVGALLAVPVAAILEIILQRFQARDEPVAADPASAA